MKPINVNGLEDYLISETGELFSTKTNKFLKQSMRMGYKSINLSNCKRKTVDIHRLLMMTYFPCEGHEKLTVNHKNGNKLDNRFENLEWVTKGENLRHALKTGLRTLPKGEEHSGAKLKESEVKEILEELKSGKTQNEIARQYGISQFQVSRIKRGLRWKHIV